MDGKTMIVFTMFLLCLWWNQSLGKSGFRFCRKAV